MYSVLIESSSKKSLISINKEEISLSYKYLSIEQDFIYEIKNLLKSQKLSVKNISYISIGIGPGSFTGIRKAASLAKTISYAMNIPIVSFCSLKSFIPDENCAFLSITDAKSNYFYVLQGEKTEKNVIYRSSFKLLEQNELCKYKIKIVSPDDLLFKNYKKKCPNKDHLAFLTYSKFMNKNFTFHSTLKLYTDFKIIPTTR